MIIIFGHSKNPDDYYIDKDFLNLKSFEPVEIKLTSLSHLLGKTSLTQNFDHIANSREITTLKLRKAKDTSGKNVVRAHKGIVSYLNTFCTICSICTIFAIYFNKSFLALLVLYLTSPLLKFCQQNR
mgnify:CR=1 FL=1